MGLTPLDAEKYEFPSGFRGYDRNAVEQFRAMVVQALEGNIQETGQLRRRITELEERLADLKGREDLIQTSMLTAQKTGEDIISNAREEAGLIKARAEADCQTLRNEMARIRAEREEFEYAFHGLLSGFLHRLEQRNPQIAAAQPVAPAAQSSPAQTRLTEPVDEMLELMNETMPAEADDEPDELAAPPAAAAPASWGPEQPAPRISPGRGNPDERDSDHDDFSRILSEAQQHTAPHLPAAPAVEVNPPPAAPARDMDEDLDISDEVELIDQQVEYEEAADWHVPDVPASAHTEPVPDAPAAPDPPPLEEVEGLRPPPPEDDPWEAASEPHADNWARAAEQDAGPEPPARADEFDESSLRYGSRLQPSRSMDEPRSAAAAGQQQYDFDISDPAEDAVPDVLQAAAGAEDEAPRQLPTSNLDEIFGGIKPPPSAEDEEDRPYRADW